MTNLEPPNTSACFGEVGGHRAAALGDGWARQEGGLMGRHAGGPLTLNGGVVVVSGAPRQVHLALLQQVAIRQLQLRHGAGAP